MGIQFEPPWDDDELGLISDFVLGQFVGSVLSRGTAELPGVLVVMQGRPILEVAEELARQVDAPENDAVIHGMLGLFESPSDRAAAVRAFCLMMAAGAALTKMPGVYPLNRRMPPSDREALRAWLDRRPEFRRAGAAEGQAG